ncbi:TetR/AcrR family transcriptional regulator [Streptomyces sp. NBC_01429]|uniref:TetR/AcrR family transcriptional regulator n=1 Tax=Streptomyces sp. NBC_01429 TaxID=2903862 RepID=UPI002E27ED19|nr:TetR/AcrR family transcriptional regulator [Streptomyces sp. NBC_01429]
MASPKATIRRPSPVSRIQAVCPLSSASLYAAFGSKEGLFQQVVEHYVKGPGSVTDLATDFGADETVGPREAIAGLPHRSIDMQADPSHPDGCLIALSGTMRAPGEDHAGARAAVLARREADRMRIRSCVEAAVTSGELDADADIGGMTSTVHGFLLGISTQLRDGVAATNLHTAADVLLSN